MKLLIPFQTSTAASLKFENGLIITYHIWLGMWLFSHAGVKHGLNGMPNSVLFVAVSPVPCVGASNCKLWNRLKSGPPPSKSCDLLGSLICTTFPYIQQPLVLYFPQFWHWPGVNLTRYIFNSQLFSYNPCHTYRSNPIRSWSLCSFTSGCLCYQCAAWMWLSANRIVS